MNSAQHRGELHGATRPKFVHFELLPSMDFSKTPSRASHCRMILDDQWRAETNELIVSLCHLFCVQVCTLSGLSRTGSSARRPCAKHLSPFPTPLMHSVVTAANRRSANIGLAVAESSNAGDKHLNNRSQKSSFSPALVVSQC